MARPGHTLGARILTVLCLCSCGGNLKGKTPKLPLTSYQEVGMDVPSDRGSYFLLANADSRVGGCCGSRTG